MNIASGKCFNFGDYSILVKATETTFGSAVAAVVIALILSCCFLVGCCYLCCCSRTEKEHEKDEEKQNRDQELEATPAAEALKEETPRS